MISAPMVRLFNFRVVSMITKFLTDLIQFKNLIFFVKSFLWFSLFAVCYYFAISLTIHSLLEHLDEFKTLSFGWLLFIVEPIAHLAFGFSIYIMITPALMLCISLYSTSIFSNIKNDHYPNVKQEDFMASHRSLLIVFRSGLFYLLIMLLCLPVLLVPLLGHLLYVFIGFIVFRKFLLIDMLGMMYAEEKVKAYSGFFSERAKFVLPTAALYFISLVPMIGFFVPYIAIIFIAHLMLNEQAKLINQEIL
jgi:hypothetical protein